MRKGQQMMGQLYRSPGELSSRRWQRPRKKKGGGAAALTEKKCTKPYTPLSQSVRLSPAKVRPPMQLYLNRASST